MKKINLVLIIAIATILASCTESMVKSLQPYYTDNTLFVKSQIEGDWLVAGDSSTVLRIAPFTYRKDPTTRVNAYKIEELKVAVISSKKHEKNTFKRINGSYFILKEKVNSTNEHPEVQDSKTASPPTLAHLMRLKNGSYYLDLTKFSDNNSDEYTIGIHEIIKLSIQNNLLLIKYPSDTFINESLKKNKVKIPLLNVKGVSSNGVVNHTTLITAESEKMQKFIQKYDDKLFTNENTIYLRRIVASK